MNASGVFELEAQSSGMLLPFEGSGVDTTWELRMPKAANFFDYRTIGDVLFTIEYTALQSWDYRSRSSSRSGSPQAATARSASATSWPISGTTSTIPSRPRRR